MGIQAELEKEILEHLQSQREVVVLTCDQCQTRWELAGPFERRHPYSCPGCEQRGVINLEKQAEAMAREAVEQLEAQVGDRVAERLGQAYGEAPHAGHQHGGGCC